MTRKEIEIMAPAGSPESLEAAIAAGADAIYFGVGTLNMRARSSVNFSITDLPDVAKRCAEMGVKSYLTMNTVVYPDDMSTMRATIDAAVEAGINAVIASDMSVIGYARSKGLPVHISTQVNVANEEAVAFYSQFADVMVLAREVALPQVSAIHKAIVERAITGPSGKEVRLEMFVHGALCMAISGKCYLSLHTYGKSANRGACLQLCRRGYRVTDIETDTELEIDNQYIMSPKDLCTIGFLNKLLDSGVRVLKIEGRARGPEYVHTVTSCYREAVEAWLDGTYLDEAKIAGWKERLSQVFNRGFWDGYYLGQKMGEWSHTYGSQATRRKVYLGKCTNWFSRLGVAEFVMETGNLKTGDSILITGATTGVAEVVVGELRLEYDPVGEVKKGDRFSLKTGVQVHRGDRLFRWDPVLPSPAGS